MRLPARGTGAVWPGCMCARRWSRWRMPDRERNKRLIVCQQCFDATRSVCMNTLTDTLTVTFKLNSKPVALAVPPLTTLRSALREHLHLHATKAGCGQGGCGSCTRSEERRVGKECRSR